MSGYVPQFIQEDHYILVNDEERLVKGYYHAAADSNRPFDDNKLVIMFENGDRLDFDTDKMKPLPALHVPDWVQKGKVVEFDHAFDDDGPQAAHRVVEGVWGQRRKCEPFATPVVSVVGMPVIPLDKIRQVSAQFNRKAQMIERGYRDAIAKDPDIFKRPLRPDSYKFS